MRTFRWAGGMKPSLAPLSCVVFCSLVGVAAGAQEYRASVMGSITDASGAAIAGAKVTLHNQGTGVDTTAASNAKGTYAINFVDPGTYVLSVDAPNFERWEMRNLRLDTAQDIKVNAKLQISSATSSVTVVADGAILESANANVAQLFDTQDLNNLPIADGNPTNLLQLVGGSINTGNPIYTRPFDVGAITSFRVNGTPGASSYYLNGVPVNGIAGAYSGQVMAFIPPAEAVDQIKAETLSYNASDGNTAAATFNFNTKSGTNQIHGSLYEYFENSYLNASNWKAEHLNQAKAAQRSNHFGGTVGGPVMLPHIYDGRNKTFFFFFLDEVRDTLPRPTSYLVPTQKMRTGDLSEVCTAGFTNGLCNNANQQIYNPFSAKATSGGHVTRQPFLNNQIPAALQNKTGLNVLSLYPQANIPGAAADGSVNYYSPNSDTDTFDAWMIRGDHYFSGSHHLAMDYFQSNRNETSGIAPGLNGAIHPAGYTYQLINHGFGLTDTVALSSSMVLDARLGFNRFEQAQAPTSLGYDLSSLGFSSAAISQFHGSSYLPPFASADLTTLTTVSPNDRVSNEYSLGASLTKSIGRHLIKFGYDGMLYRINYNSEGNNLGTYTFNGNYASQTDTSVSQYGMGIADLLVGQPTAGSIAINSSYAEQILYHAAYVQDDWKISPKLTLTVGLRYEFEGAPTERYNRNTRGFDLTSANPTQGAAQSNFAALFPQGLNPGSGLPVKTQLSVLGGYTWADSTHRGFFNADKKVFLPRLGVAYEAKPGTILRGGGGIYKIPLVTSMTGYPAGNQTGFSQTTTLTPSTDNGLTFVANINNPFPYGVVQPTGSSLGLYQNLGTSASFFPENPPTEYAAHWTAEIQQALPSKWVLDLAYLGSAGWNLTNTSYIASAVPAAYFSTSKTRDTALINAMTATVRNPFQGLLGTTAQNSTALNTGSTVQVQQLLRPRPQFTNVSQTAFNSDDNYHSLNAKLMRRFGNGYSFNATYTWSKLIEHYGFDNDFQVTPNKEISGQDVPNRLTATFVAEMPFGKTRKWLNRIPTWADTVIGGWQASGTYQAQSGSPLDFGNVAYFGDPSTLHFNYQKSLVGTGTPMIDVSGFYLPTDANGKAWASAAAQRADSRISLSNNIRYMPHNMGNTRSVPQNNVDLTVMKKMQVTEKVSAQIRASFLNAFNRPWFTNPYTTPTAATFGTLDGNQKNNPRYIQLNARIVF